MLKLSFLKIYDFKNIFNFLNLAFRIHVWWNLPCGERCGPTVSEPQWLTCFFIGGMSNRWHVANNIYVSPINNRQISKQIRWFAPIQTGDLNNRISTTCSFLREIGTTLHVHTASMHGGGFHTSKIKLGQTESRERKKGTLGIFWGIQTLETVSALMLGIFWGINALTFSSFWVFRLHFPVSESIWISFSRTETFAFKFSSINTLTAI